MKIFYERVEVHFNTSRDAVAVINTRGCSGIKNSSAEIYGAGVQLCLVYLKNEEKI